jgi:methionyl aminopeptidase
MIDYKTPKDIEIMRRGGLILSQVLFAVMDALKPGVTEIEIDRLAEKMILEQGGKPGFKKVKGYHHTVCISTNDVVVHGIPGKYKFKAGDVVGVDCGVFYNGFHTDMSETIRFSKLSSLEDSNHKSDEIDRFLEIGKKALKDGIAAAKVGNRIGHISKAIQDRVEGNGYAIVRSLIGHGVGRELHEAPEVPGYLVRDIAKTPLLKEGMTIAIEVIYNMGKPDVMLAADGWTIRTTDGALAGLFERTIALTKAGPLQLTPERDF